MLLSIGCNAMISLFTRCIWSFRERVLFFLAWYVLFRLVLASSYLSGSVSVRKVQMRGSVDWMLPFVDGGVTLHVGLVLHVVLSSCVRVVSILVLVFVAALPVLLMSF